MNIKTYLCVFFLTLWVSGNAQNNKNENEQPLWIEMMEDSTVNYYTAVEIFNNYWKGKEKPKEESEIFSKKTKSNSVIKYAFEFKKFKKWQKINLPFVKKDGTILSKNEKLKIWETSKKNRR